MMTTDKTTYSAASSCGKLRRMLVWLSRMRHSRGFGVQSPWAYRMVRYVINEHYPYYAYDDLALSYPGLGVVERKMCELCLRLANSVQPSLVVNFDDAGALTAHISVPDAARRASRASVRPCRPCAFPT